MILGGLLLCTDYVLVRLFAWIVGKPTQRLRPRRAAGRRRLRPEARAARRSDLDDFDADEDGDDAGRPHVRPAGRRRRRRSRGEDEPKRPKKTPSGRRRRRAGRGRPQAARLARCGISQPEAARAAEKVLEETGRVRRRPERRRLRAARRSICCCAGEPFCFDEQEKEVRRKAKILEKTFARFRLQHPRGRDPDRAGHRPVRGGVGGRPAAEQDHRPGRRPGHRPARAQRAHRGPAPRQEHRRHRGAQQRAADRPPPRGDGRGQRQGPEDADPDLPGQGRGRQSAGRRSDHAAAPADRRPHRHGQERVPELDHRLDAHDPAARRSPHADDRPEDGRAEPLQDACRT